MTSPFRSTGVAGSLLALLLFSTGPAAAVPADTHGRAADGKPYRIDQGGMRLSDYLAELEVDNDDLKRQVQTLEDELDVQNAKCGKPEPKQPIRESSLPAAGLPAASQRVNVELLCQQKVQPLQTRISDLEMQLKQTVKAEPARAVPATCDYQSPENPLWAKIRQLEAQLTDRPTQAALSAERSGREDLQGQLEHLRSEVQSKGGELSSRADEIRELRAQLESANHRVAELESSAAATSRASLATPPVKQTARAVDTAAREAEEPAGNTPAKDLESSRKELRERLGKIQELVLQRKNLLDASKGRSKGVSVGIQSLVTKRGDSLDTLRVLVSKLSSEEDVTRARAGVSDVEAILNEDMQVLSRLAHGR